MACWRLLLDEAGMASTRGTERLLAAVQAEGAKVVAIGDPGQLPSVQAGGWMRESVSASACTA